jgi:hypothetical protein
MFCRYVLGSFQESYKDIIVLKYFGVLELAGGVATYIATPVRK